MECRESLKDIANLIAQDACLGDDKSKKIANKLLAMPAIYVMNRKQEVINEFFLVVGV